MYLPISAKLTPKLIWRESSGSTNLELIHLAQSESLPDFTVLVTADQHAGRGRAGRVWETPAGTALAISVLLRPRLESQTDLGKLGWLPLLAGLAMTECVQGILPGRAGIGVKWPNDVLITDQKVCGVLSELVPLNASSEASEFGQGMVVVVGAGINITQQRAELPVETATSLSLEGAQLPFDDAECFDLVLSGYLGRLAHWYQKFTDAKLAAVASGLRQAVVENCVTLGRPVRAILPGDTEQLGRAVTIDDSGRLVLDTNGQPVSVAAGDIVHLRHN
jgi:BirA family transcriptional regulator, biotin operon repressor / biotin---[acetyl-CoA-carboxylase] ligase